MLIVCDHEWNFVGAKGDYSSKQLTIKWHVEDYHKYVWNQNKLATCGTENSENTETSKYPGRMDNKLTLEQGPVKSYPDDLSNSH